MPRETSMLCRSCARHLNFMCVVSFLKMSSFYTVIGSYVRHHFLSSYREDEPVVVSDGELRKTGFDLVNIILINLVVLMFGSIGEWSPVIISVLSLHPKANSELQQVRCEPLQ